MFRANLKAHPMGREDPVGTHATNHREATSTLTRAQLAT